MPLASVWLAENDTARTVVLNRLFDGQEAGLDAAVRNGDDAISAEVDRTETTDLVRRGGSGWMPSGIRRALLPADAGVPVWPPNPM